MFGQPIKRFVESALHCRGLGEAVIVTLQN
jgi:hypothetical protein